MRIALRFAGAPRSATASPTPSRVERVHRVREQRDPGADGLDARRALEDNDLVPGPPQPDRCAEAADACADDDYAHCASASISTFQRGSRKPVTTTIVDDGPGLAEDLGVRGADRVAVGGVGDEHARAHHVARLRARPRAAPRR